MGSTPLCVSAGDLVMDECMRGDLTFLWQRLLLLCLAFVLPWLC